MRSFTLVPSAVLPALPGLCAVALSLLLAAPATAQERVYLLGAEATNGDDFGRTVCSAGDIDFDGIPDIAVGAPTDNANGAASGSVSVYSGRTGERIWIRHGEYAGDLFGWSLDGVGDLDADGRGDLIVGAPGWDNNGLWDANSGSTYLLRGNGGFPMVIFSYNSQSANLGYAVCGLGDIDGDGVGDYAMSTPYRDSNGFTNNGYVSFFSGAGNTFLFSRAGTEDGAAYGYSIDGVRATGAQATSRLIVGAPQVDGAGVDRGLVYLMDGFGNTVSLFAGSTNNEWMGSVVAGLGDVNGDGSEDYGFSSPYTDLLGVGADAGRVRVYSGFSTSLMFNIDGATAGANMGMSFAGVGDVNGDGRDDVLAGAPNDDTAVTDGGEARLVSGLAGIKLNAWYGGFNDHMGRGVGSAGDLNGDGLGDLVFGAPDAPFGAGQAYVHLAGTTAPTIYCTAKQNSQGCIPAISAVGTPSLSIADDFVVSAGNVLNEKLGILFWGTGTNSAPFKGGTLCVQTPVQRTPVQDSGGNVGPDDCSGSYAFAFSHAYMSAKGIGAGTSVYAQFWSRDPNAPFTVGLTDAVGFHVVP